MSYWAGFGLQVQDITSMCFLALLFRVSLTFAPTVKETCEFFSYRCQLVKAGEELVKGHHQLLGCALRRQACETLDVCK